MKIMTAMAAGTAILALALTGCQNGAVDADAAGSDDTIRFAYYDTGGAAVTSYVSQVLAEQTDIQEANGIKVEAVPYKNVSALYTDLNRNRVDVVSTGPAVAASNAAQGAPMVILGTVAPTSVSIVSKDKEWNKESLQGARITGFGEGSKDLLEAWVLESWGLKAGSDYEFLPAQANSAAIAQVSTGSADFAMAWQPHVMDGLEKFPDLQEAAMPEDLVPDSRRSWQFVLVGNKEAFDEDKAEAFRNAVADTADYMTQNVGEVDALATKNNAPEGLLETSVNEGKVTIEVLPVDDDVQRELETDYEQLVNAGKLEAVPDVEIYSAD